MNDEARIAFITKRLQENRAKYAPRYTTVEIERDIRLWCAQRKVDLQKQHEATPNFAVRRSAAADQHKEPSRRSTLIRVSPYSSVRRAI